MAGMVRAVLIIEAEEKSGTLITARLATEYNRDVLWCQKYFFRKFKRHTHMLLRLGATPIMSSKDILEALGSPSPQKKSEKKQMHCTSASPEERTCLNSCVNQKKKMNSLHYSTHQSLKQMHFSRSWKSKE